MTIDREQRDAYARELRRILGFVSDFTQARVSYLGAEADDVALRNAGAAVEDMLSLHLEAASRARSVDHARLLRAAEFRVRVASFLREHGLERSSLYREVCGE